MADLPVKAGYKTTEFWVNIASNVAAILATVSGAIDPKVGGILMVVSNTIYTISRAFAKK